MKALLTIGFASVLVAAAGAQRGRGNAPAVETAPTPPGPPRVEALQ